MPEKCPFSPREKFHLSLVTCGGFFHFHFLMMKLSKETEKKGMDFSKQLRPEQDLWSLLREKRKWAWKNTRKKEKTCFSTQAEKQFPMS